MVGSTRAFVHTCVEGGGRVRSDGVIGNRVIIGVTEGDCNGIVTYCDTNNG